ncbi:hypothetical protein XOC_4428 [Xanthomonas oryzae pv. oryzicola BLS256]|uniref:Uncharacterized protein n=1 Tax=Xanthomonas oryzae pv. oryzicola (strain BLS256) TaxID=383407 RepID=G7TAA5_XANOB|nr:hypothetical protein XOC_4428 [Xanthomonas oryzae pv. oryzicola BLS256]QEO95292.1 hypothetical protein XOCgx_0297 [Xanthomonas oryzae pv. oryzicola]
MWNDRFAKRASRLSGFMRISRSPTTMEHTTQGRRGQQGRLGASIASEEVTR